MEKKNVVFLTVLAVATLLTAVVGTTFAYFTASVSGNNTATPTVITTANNLGISYQDGAEIHPATPVEPGWSQTKTITVTNNSASNAIGYQIKWTDVTNGFVTGNENGAENATLSKDFVYTITKNGADYITTASTVATYPVTGTDLDNITTGMAYSPAAGKAAIKDSESTTTLNAVEFPATGAVDSIVASNNSLAAGQTDTYVITFMFLETNRDQNENTNKTFSAKLQANIIDTEGVHSNG